MSIERFIAVNLVMNGLVLTLAARMAGYVRARRIAGAAVLGTAYAALAYGMEPGWLRGPWMQLLCMALMSATLLGRRQGMRASGWLCVAGSAMFAGGLLLVVRRFVPADGPYLAVGCPLVALSAWLARRAAPRLPTDHRLRLRIVTHMGSAELCALVDTGNRLREPLSGLPVVIVEARLLRGVLDGSCLRAEGSLPPGFRLVRYGALGGEGELRCFRPRAAMVWRGGRWEKTSDVWIGIYPGALPAQVDALAPPLLCERR